MILRPTRVTRTATLFPSTTLFRARVRGRQSCRSWLELPAFDPPLVGALDPGVDRGILKRGGKARRAAVRRAEPPRERLRSAVAGVDAVHQLRPFQKLDREIARGDRALEGVAAPGEFGANAIADRKRTRLNSSHQCA